MTDTNAILKMAQQRALANQLPYAGALTPIEACNLVDAGGAVLVDVRSRAELELVGRVPHAIHIEWAIYPGMTPNPDFSAQLASLLDQNKSIVFMCRTGGRSHHAAVVATQLGFTAYNMLEGFEGDANEQRQRTLINGWKYADLPWSN